jgi:hypothetical protein
MRPILSTIAKSPMRVSRGRRSWKRALVYMRHSRASLHGENPNRILNGEVRSQFSLYSLSGQTSRLVRTSDPRCCQGPSIDVGCTRCAGERVHRVFRFTEPELQRRMNWRASITTARRSFPLHRQGLRGSWLSKTAGRWLDSTTRRSNGIRNRPMISIGRHRPLQGQTSF